MVVSSCSNIINHENNITICIVSGIASVFIIGNDIEGNNTDKMAIIKDSCPIRKLVRWIFTPNKNIKMEAARK